MANKKSYSKQCSAVGTFAYASYFKLYVDLEETSVSTSGNSSKVKYTVYCESSGSGSINAKHLKYFKINGSTIINETDNVNVSSPNAYIAIASGTTGAITHNSDGTKTISFEAEIKASSYGVSAKLSDTFELTAIPRYATLSHSLRSRTVNSIIMNWASDSTCNQVQYKIGNGSWITVSSSDAKSGTYTIGSLSPNTAYSITTRVRRKDSQLYTSSSALSVTTYDIARLTSYPNFNLGSNVTVGYTNPSGAAIQVGLYKDGNTPIAPYRNCSGSSYTFNFTDEELDTMYKMMTGNTLIAYFYINTNNNTYRERQEIMISLTGNQKTVRANVNSSWRRGKLWIKINNVWKRAVIWKNDGTWKRGI